MSVTFFADSGEIMVGARVACYTYGRFNVTLPEGKELAIDEYDTGYSDGYIYRPPEHTEFDDFDFAFVQADIEVDVNALWSDFEAVIDEAQKKVAEDVYFDADIEGTGLGRYKFGKHYKVGDIVRVGILGGQRYITAPVTQVTHLPSGEPRVHVGGQAIRDRGLVEEQNRQVHQAIAKAAAQNRNQLSQVSSTARAAQGTAAAALDAVEEMKEQIAAGVDTTRFDELMAEHSRKLQELADATAGFIDPSRIAAGSIHGSKITAGTLTAHEIAAGTITGTEIAADSIMTEHISAAGISADKIVGGEIDASKVDVTNLNASNITSGTISADLIHGGSIDGSLIRAGTLTADRVDADEIFLRVDGEQSISDQWKLFQEAIQSQAENIEYLLGEISKMRSGNGIEFTVSEHKLTGGDGYVELREDSSKKSTVLAVGNWTGVIRGVRTIEYYSSDSLPSFETYYDGFTIDAINRGFTVDSTKSFYGGFRSGTYAIYLDESVLLEATTLRSAVNFEIPRSQWVNPSEYTYIVPEGAASLAVKASFEFLSPRKKATYGMRILLDGNPIKTWTADNFGVLTSIGDQEWTTTLTVTCDVIAGDVITIEVYSDHEDQAMRLISTNSTATFTPYT